MEKTEEVEKTTFTSVPINDSHSSDTETNFLEESLTSHNTTNPSYSPRNATENAPEIMPKQDEKTRETLVDIKTLELLQTISCDIEKETNSYQEKYLEYARTKILDPYLKLNPKLEMIYQNKVKNKVYLVTLKDERKLILKQITFNYSDTSSLLKMARCLKEYYINKELEGFSDNIAKVFDIKLIKNITENEIVMEILTEYAGTDLAKINPITLHEAFDTIILQLVSALAIMESAGISHLDIKPRNIVYNEKYKTLKIIDFGTAIQFFRNPSYIAHKLEEHDGKVSGFTRVYASPETLQANIDSREGKKEAYKNIIPLKADVYSFGVTLFELLLISCNEPKAFDEFMKNHYGDKNIISLIEQKLAWINETRWFDLIKNCLNVDPDERPTFKRIKEEFFENNKIHAISPYCELKKTSTENSKYFKKLAELRLELGEYEAVIYYCNKYLELKTKINNKSINPKIFYLIAQAYLGIHEIDNATDNLEKALKLINKIKDPKKEQIESKIYEMLSECSLEKGNSLESRELIIKSIEIYPMDGEENLLHASRYNIMGRVFLQFKEYSNAKHFFKQQIKIIMKIIGKENIELPKALMNLCDCYAAEGNYENAKKCINRAIKITIRNFGEKSGLLIDLYYRQAINNKMLGALKDSIESLMNARNLFILNYGEDHINLSRIYIFMIEIYSELRNFEYAKFFAKRAMSVIKTTKGEKCIEMADAYNKFGKLLETQGKFREALDPLKTAEKIYKDLFNDKYPSLAMTYLNFGSVYINLGNFDQAEYFLNQSMNLVKQYYGEENIFMANINDLLGRVYQNMSGKYEKALEYHLKACKILQMKLGENNPILIKTFSFIGSAYYKLENYGKAVEFYNKCTEICIEIFGDDCQYLSTIYNNIALIYMKQNKFEDAIKHLAMSLKIEETHFKTGNLSMANIYQNTGNCYFALEKYDIALENYTKSKDFYITLFGNSNERVESINERIKIVKNVIKTVSIG